MVSPAEKEVAGLAVPNATRDGSLIGSNGDDRSDAEANSDGDEHSNGEEHSNGDGNGTVRKPPRRRATAQSMAASQRDISVSEFFAKNRHLLGFDNPRKALLTTVKEAVDNALDACEEAGILPEIWVHIRRDRREPLSRSACRTTARASSKSRSP